MSDFDLVRDERLRPEQIPAFVDSLEAEVRSRRLRAWGTGLGLIVGFGGGALAATIATQGGAAICLIFSLIFGIVLLFSGLNQANRKGAKVAFLRQLLDALRDELHPKAKVHVRFDLRHYDTADKTTWTGKSPYGNPKSKYTDKWLHLDVKLADGSEVRVVRQAGLKTKSGNIQKEKRRVFLSFQPNPWLYRLAPGETHADLARRLHERVSTALHDPPEGFKVTLDGGDGKFRLKIMQLDAPVLADEVVFAVREILEYLAPKKI